MTDNQIINAAVSDPIVVRARSVQRPDGSLSAPTGGELLQAAKTELASEVASLLGIESISRALLEQEKALTVSSGGTDVQQGTWWKIPDGVGLIVGVTVGTTRKPLMLMTSRQEFNRWWYYEHGTQDVSADAQRVIQWDETVKKERTILVSPGVGSDGVLYLLHRRRVTDLSAANFEDEDHHVVLLGLKNRLSGGQYAVGYEQALAMLKARVPPISFVPTPMRRDPRVERLAWRLSRIYGRGDPYGSRVYPSSS